MKYFDFHSFAQHCEDFFTVVDFDFRFVEVNRVWCSFLKLTEGDIISTDLLQQIFHEDIEGFKNTMQNLPAGGFISKQRLRLLGFNHNFIYTRYSARKTKNGFNIVFRNVSQETEDARVVRKAAQMGDLGAWSHDPLANKSYWNEVVYTIYDLGTDAPMDHETVVNLYHPEDKERMLGVIGRLYKEQKGYDEVTRIVTPKNNLKWIRVMAEPVVNEGKIIWISGFAQDITQRQTIHEKIKQSEEQKYLALKGIKSGIFDHDLVNDEIEYSPDFKKMLGIKNKSQLQNLTDFIHPDDLEEATARFFSGIKNPGHYYTNHFRLRDTKDGYRHYEIFGWRKKDPQSKRTIRIIGNAVDVHERVLAEKKQKNYLAQMEALLNNGFVNSVLLDVKGRVLMADEDTRKLGVLEFGADAVEANAYFGDILPLDERKRFETELPKVLSGEKVRKEVQHVYADGSIGWLDVTYNPVRINNGEITGLVISFMDIGKAKMTEIERRYNQSRLDELNRMKGNIISNLSHEIRTPLNGIINSTELLSDANSEEEIAGLLDIQKKSSDRLLNTIDGIVNLSRVEAEKNTLEQDDVEISALLQSCFDKLYTQAKVKGLDMILKNINEPIFLIADRLMLEQSIINVINNAVKFTVKGGVTISSFRVADEIWIEVQDSGIGISIESQERIFSDFEQESIGHARAFEGTGVGLSFTKKFLELIGGQIHVVSIKGEGSIFTITLPVRK